MQYSIVTKQNLNAEIRIDAEYYTPEAIENDRKITELSHTTIEQLGINVVSGPFGSALKSESYLEEGIPFIRISNLSDFYINEQDLIYISEEDNNRIKSSQLRVGDFVLSKVGNTIGVVSKISKKIGCCNISENNLGIKFPMNFPEPRKNYILTLLNSKNGQIQILRRISGNGQPKLNVSDVSCLYIPLFSADFENIISCCIEKVDELINKSNEQYHFAETSLLRQFSLMNKTSKQGLSYIKNFSDVQTANRLDAEYFQPKYDEILEIINRNNHTTLMKQFDIIRNSGLEYDSEGKNGVIKTKQIKDRFIDFNVEDRTNQGDSNIIVKNQDVLFASMGVGSLGKANIYYDFENDDNYIIDSTLKIFRAKTGNTLSPEYLDVYLHSQLAQELIYQNVIGSSGIISIYESYLQNLPIPLVDDKTEKKIIENVKNAHLCNFKSKQLLEIAKHGVEKAIEENEEIAMQWIDEQLELIGVTL